MRMKKSLLCLSLFIISICISMLVNAQENEQLTISGTIFSAENGLPLTGVSITIKGNKQGIATKADGTFSIKAYKGQTIDISSVGFEKQEIKVNKTEYLQITMKATIVETQEVVVIGYGTRKKSHLTGAVTKVTNDNLGQIPVSRADLALQGKMAGVNITSTDAEAGVAPTIQIRGATSITAGTQPLIVIDGYPSPVDMSAIDMNDVESIEVLKDAASCAIYGSRGGNGVILITTKGGKAGIGKLIVNVSSGIKNVYRRIPFSSLEQWKQYVLNDNGGVMPANVTASGQIAQAEKFDAHTIPQDVIFRPANYTNIQISGSGGTAQFKYYASLSGMLDEGVVIGNSHKRLGMRVGFTAKVTPKVTLDFGLTPSYEEVYLVPIQMDEALREMAPWMPAYQTAVTAQATGMPIGSIVNGRDFDQGWNPNYSGPTLESGTGNSPLQQINGTTNKTTQIRNITNLSLKIDFNRYLSFKSTLGFMVGSSSHDIFQRSYAQADPVLDGLAVAQLSSFGSISKVQVIDLSNENILSYKRIYKKHDFDFIAGFSTQYTNVDTVFGQAGDFANDNLSTFNAGVMQNLRSGVEEEALVSVLSRINYAYDNKYLISVSDRADGESKFAPGKRWGYFPAVSVGWKLSNEKFFPDNKYVNDIKIRASYGATGNKNIPNYQYFAQVTPGYASLGNSPTPGFQLTSFGNDDLTWERTYATNLAADLGLFNNKLRLTVDVYSAETDKLLYNLQIPTSTGDDSYLKNVGKVNNKGIEVELSLPVINKGNFKWNIAANCSSNKNELLDLGGLNNQIIEGDPKRANFYINQIGQPLTQFFGYKADSVVPIKNTIYWPIDLTSLHAFAKDMNKDGKITTDDRVVLGNPYPKFNWGFTSNLQYKQFDMSITLHASMGAKVFNIDPYYLGTEYGTSGAQAKNNQGYDSATLSRIVIKTQTDLFIQDASFIAIRNLNIGYTIPTKTLKKIYMARFRIYCSAANLWYHMASNYTSFNPEGDNGYPGDPLRKGYQRGSVPLARTITFGANIEF